MSEHDAIEDPKISPSEDLEDEGATDIVGRTGEEMPLATHDQPHGFVHPRRPGQALVLHHPESKPTE